MLQQELLTAEEIFVKDICGFYSSCLKLFTTSSDTEGLPFDLPLLKLPVRTNLLNRSLRWAYNDVSWSIKSRYLATYSCLQAVTEYIHSPLRRVLKTAVLLFWAWINENYCNSHLKNVKTIKTTTSNDRLQMTLMTRQVPWPTTFLESFIKTLHIV